MAAVERIRGRIVLLTQLVHHGDEKTGSTPILRTMTIWSEALGKHVRVPFVSGNAIRGMLRRLIFHDLLTRLGLETAETPKLHHALFSGGVLEAVDSSEGEIDIAFRRLVRETVPPIALWGTAVGNQMIPGSLLVEHAFPAARETAHMARTGYFLVDPDDPRFLQPVRTFTEIDFHTRRDDLRAERSEDEQAVQMKVEFEVLIPGTLLMHGFELKYATELEKSCLGHALNLWRELPVLAGKSATGHGRVDFAYEPWYDAAPYLDYVESNKQKILEVLARMQEYLGEVK